MCSKLMLNRVIPKYTSPSEHIFIPLSVKMEKIEPLHTYVHANSIVMCSAKEEASWRFEGGPLMNNSMSKEVSGRSNSYMVFLVINYVTKENQGRYECIYEREYGLVYGDYITLLVYDSPKHLLRGMTYTPKLTHN